MLKNAYATGHAAALARYGVKDAGLKEMLMPFALAGGIGGGGTAIAAGAHHLMKHPPHLSMPSMPPASSMMPQVSHATELPNFGGAMKQELSRLDAASNAR